MQPNIKVHFYNGHQILTWQDTVLKSFQLTYLMKQSLSNNKTAERIINYFLVEQKLKKLSALDINY